MSEDLRSAPMKTAIRIYQAFGFAVTQVNREAEI